MGTRFRKSVNLGGGTRLTASKSGLTLSGGVKGARTSISTSGRRRSTVSMPGTGISYTKEHGSHGGKAKASHKTAADYSYSYEENYNCADDTENFSTALDIKTLQSLNNDAFQAYANSYIEYAKSQCENPTGETDPEELRKQLAIIREEPARRKNSIEAENSKNRKNGIIGSLILTAIFAIVGFLCGFFGKVICFTLAFIFLLTSIFGFKK